jgi:hypothetical protein
MPSAYKKQPDNSYSDPCLHQASESEGVKPLRATAPKTSSNLVKTRGGHVAVQKNQMTELQIRLLMSFDGAKNDCLGYKTPVRCMNPLVPLARAGVVLDGFLGGENRLPRSGAGSPSGRGFGSGCSLGGRRAGSLLANLQRGIFFIFGRQFVTSALFASS